MIRVIDSSENSNLCTYKVDYEIYLDKCITNSEMYQDMLQNHDRVSGYASFGPAGDMSDWKWFNEGSGYLYEVYHEVKLHYNPMKDDEHSYVRRQLRRLWEECGGRFSVKMIVLKNLTRKKSS